MGQIQNKYHVTNDGKIFSVLNDGSVKEIGNVSQLSKPVIIEKEVVEVRKSGAWKWIAIFAIVLLIASIIFFFINKQDSDNYINYLQDRLYNLEQGDYTIESVEAPVEDYNNYDYAVDSVVIEAESKYDDYYPSETAAAY